MPNNFAIHFVVLEWSPINIKTHILPTPLETWLLLLHFLTIDPQNRIEFLEQWNNKNLIGTKVFLHQMVAYVPTFQTHSTKINTFGPSRFPNALYQKCWIFCTKEIKQSTRPKKIQNKILVLLVFFSFEILLYFSYFSSFLQFYTSSLFPLLSLFFFSNFFPYFSLFSSPCHFFPSFPPICFFFLFLLFFFFFFFFEKQNMMITSVNSSSSSFETKGHMNFFLNA